MNLVDSIARLARELGLTVGQALAHREHVEYGWRHAFAYADCYVSAEQAERYADHYVSLVRDEINMGYWPSHGPTFADWYRTQP